MTDNAVLQRTIELLEASLHEKDATIGQKDATIEQQNNLLSEQKQTLDAQQLEISLLLKQLFGKRSERYIEDPRQLKLDLGIDDEQVDDAVDGLMEAVEEAGRRRRRKNNKPRRDALPENLPRYEVLKDVPESEKECSEHGPRKLIGYDTTETLEYERPKLRVRVTKYPKYVCERAADCGVLQVARPQGLVEGDRYDSSVAAEIITAKYGFHQPVYRQQDLFAGSGWTPSRGTLLNVLTTASAVIRPLIDFFSVQVREDAVIGTDDTGVKLIIPQTLPTVIPGDSRSQRIHDVLEEAVTSGKSVVNAKMWVYRGVRVPINVFDFTVSRHRDGPDAFLLDHNYEGVLLGDCYAGYTGISVRSSDAIQHAACLAHARRKIHEARHSHPQHAAVLLGMFRQLYDIEDEVRGQDVAARLEIRLQKSQDIWDALRKYLDESMGNVLSKDSMGKAVGYLNNQWTALTHHLSDGGIPIDNNDAEQLMKQVAIGRKNWLFIGSVAAGHRAADLMTLVSSALRNDLDVWAYVKGVLDALLSGRTDYVSLRPDVWAESHPDHIREYRVEERRDRADRKQSRRELRRQFAADNA